MILEEYANKMNLYEKTKSFYGMKIKFKVKELIDKELEKKKKNILILEKLKKIINLEKNNKLNYINNELKVKEEKKIVNKLINLCIRKGKKKLAHRIIKQSWLLIREFFWINPVFLLKLAIYQSEPIIKLDKYIVGNKERIIPRFIKNRLNIVLREIVNMAKNKKINYKYFYVSLVYAILEYSMPDNIMMHKNKEINELAELNKYVLYKKKKKRKKKLRILKKIKDWKK